MFKKISEGVTPSRIVLAVTVFVGACLIAVAVVVLSSSDHLVRVSPSMSADNANCAVWQTTSAGGTFSTPYFRDGAVCVEWNDNLFVVPSVTGGDWVASQVGNPFVVDGVTGGDWVASQVGNPFVVPSVTGGDWEVSQNSTVSDASSTSSPVVSAPVSPPVSTPAPTPVVENTGGQVVSGGQGSVGDATSISVNGDGTVSCYLNDTLIATVVSVGYCTAIFDPSGITVKPQDGSPSIGVATSLTPNGDGSFELFVDDAWVASVSDVSLIAPVFKFAENQ